MESNPYFYFSTTRKLVDAFGAIFNNFTVIHSNNATGDELDRMLVPITYAPKEKYIVRLGEDPDLTRSIQVQLPRMSFEITGIAYDPARQQQATLKNISYTEIGSNNGSYQYSAVPYNVEFALYIYTRLIDDANQIVEQIFPLFNPQFDISIDYVPEMDNATINTPFILKGVDQNIEYTGTGDRERLVVWTLSFTCKTYYFGAISSQGLITKANTRFFVYNWKQTPPMYMLANSGSVNYQTGEYAFQGLTLYNSSASGKVVSWDANNLILTVGQTIGSFTTNAYVTGANSHANWWVSAFAQNATPIVIVTTTPDPPTANIQSNYGYLEYITEYFPGGGT